MKVELSQCSVQVLENSLLSPDMFDEVTRYLQEKAERAMKGEAEPEISKRTQYALSAYAVVGYLVMADFVRCKRDSIESN